MEATQQFIEDAVKGGAIDEYPTFVDRGDVLAHATICRILLDPLAWQAVGKTRGWNTLYSYHEYRLPKRVETAEVYWTEIEYKQHTFIDHLADGKTIEEALSLIQD